MPTLSRQSLLQMLVARLQVGGVLHILCALRSAKAITPQTDRHITISYMTVGKVGVDMVDMGWNGLALFCGK
ncbi:MAG: hypothetical protein DMG70_05880 [Acidobacteria bacterium]|nr:MAG: hypothetical protein DMG70_05880 [Acidobacteriota bacterium]